MARRSHSPLTDWHDAFDQLASRLLGSDEQGRRSLLVTACHAGAGASTVAQNVAVALARRRRGRALLVDGNLRSPSLHEALHVPRSSGLAEAANFEIPIEDALLWSEQHANLWFMTAGRRLESPVLFLESPELESFLKVLESSFEYVVFDSAPVGSCPEALILARQVGSVVLVLEAESTRWEVAQGTKRLLEEARVQVPGVVLNRKRHHVPSWLYRLL